MNKPLVIGLGVAGAVVVGGGAWWFMKGRKTTSTTMPAGGTDPARDAPPVLPTAPPRLSPAEQWALDHGGQPMPVPGQPQPVVQPQPQPVVQPVPAAPQQFLWMDKAGNTQPASSITDLRSKMLKEWGSSKVASSVMVLFPGETQWHMASFKIFGLFDKFPSPDPSSWTIDPTSWSERVKRGEEPLIEGGPLVNTSTLTKTPLNTPGLGFKAMGRVPSGYGVRRDYADAAGLAYNAALERMNGRGGAQMVSGRAGR